MRWCCRGTLASLRRTLEALGAEVVVSPPTNRDILSADPETIEDTKVLATYLDGGLVYSASPSGGVAESEEEPGNWWQEREVRQRTWLKHD